MRGFVRSFVYAGRGVALAARGRNLRVMSGCAIVAVVTGVVVGLSAGEWALVAVSIGLVLAIETVNTAIERLADAVDSEPNPAVGAAKDLAAGASLLVAIMSAVVGLLVFGPRLW